MADFLDLLILGVLATAGIIMALLAVILAVQSVARTLLWKRSRGMIVGHKREDGKYLPMIEHCVDGEVFRFTSDFGSGVRNGKRGDPIRILYNPKRPECGALATFASLWLFPLVLGLMSGIFLRFPGYEFCMRVLALMDK